jgi:ABC-2 type transport system permease protein
MTAIDTLTWFARHELRIAWRDWLQMMSGGLTRKDRAIVFGTLGFFGLLHGVAYLILKPVMTADALGSQTALIVLSALLLSAFTMMLAQALEQITRVFYARADLDLILSSPVASEHLFAVRILSVAIIGFAMTSLLASPFVNMAAIIDGPQWLSAYAMIAALAMLATAIAVLLALTLFRTLGPKRARLVSQIVAAVIGASLLIGLQIAAIMAYGNMSRFDVLRSGGLAAVLPSSGSAMWTPAKALMGNGAALLTLLALSAALLTVVTARYASRFAACTIAASGVTESVVTRRTASRPFTSRSPVRALRMKEWQLLARDPWLASQTVMQVFYLIPPALLLWRDNEGLSATVIAVPVLVMAFGQLAGGLSWLALSGEDAPDLVATSPVRPGLMLRAKIEAVLSVIAVIALPLILLLALASAQGAAAAAFCIAAASGSAITIQMWFRSAAKRSQFRRRQTASRAATFSEAFSSIFWAVTAGFAAAGSWFAAAFALLALLTLAVARAIRPRGRASGATAPVAYSTERTVCRNCSSVKGFEIDAIRVAFSEARRSSCSA